MQHPQHKNPSARGETDSCQEVWTVAEPFAVHMRMEKWMRFGHWWASPHTRYRTEALSLPIRQTYDTLQP
jgi:hypothetical protein